MSDEVVHQRTDDVVWRLGPDRVIVRRIGDWSPAGAVELLGDAAVAWLDADD